VNDLEIFESVIFGEVILTADNRDQENLVINSRFSGNDNNMTFTGSVNTAADTSILDLNLDIANLNLASVEPLLQSQVRELSGSLTGEISVEGSANEPEINGQLSFMNTQMLPNLLVHPSRYRMKPLRYAVMNWC
jgi:translocation and assembly module TamB